MPIASLSALRCPSCTGPLAAESEGTSMSEGVVRCRCARHPVVGGVLVLDPAVSAALVAILDRDDRPGLEAFATRELGVDPAVLRGEPASLFEAVERQKPLCPNRFEWMLHIQHWFRTPKFRAALRLMAPLRAASPRVVLDLGAGAGHLGQLALQWAGVERLYALDRSFAHLIQARWMIDGQTLVQTDARRGMPAVDGAFDAVLNADSLHYMDGKEQILAEVSRVRRRSGAVLFTHLHNAECADEPFQGASLPGPEWESLFRAHFGEGIRLVADEQIRAGHEQTALASPWQDYQGVARSFTAMTAPPVPAALPTLEDPIDGCCINPIYDVELDGDSLRLVRRTLTPVFEDEFEAEDPPATIRVERARLDDAGYRRMLRLRAIVIDAPRGMIDAPTIGALFGR
ncbi:Hypothetical protein A7982_01286 [Minicystis rosea]|nr:Hypothetical protein A7982_01286 [Minicystis rosea]